MCRGEGEASFVVCLLFKCEETDTLTDKAWQATHACPQCDEAHAFQFPQASAGKLEAAGLDLNTLKEWMI